MKKTRDEVVRLLRSMGALFVDNGQSVLLSPNFVSVLKHGVNRLEMDQVIRHFGRAVAQKLDGIVGHDLVIGSSVGLVLSVSDCLGVSKAIVLSGDRDVAMFGSSVRSKKVVLADLNINGSTDKLYHTSLSLGADVVMICALFKEVSTHLPSNGDGPEVFSLIDFYTGLPGS